MICQPEYKYQLDVHQAIMYVHSPIRAVAVLQIQGIRMDEKAEITSGKTMSVPEAGKELGLSRNASYAAARRGEIPVLRFGKKLRVPTARFERMLEEGK